MKFILIFLVFSVAILLQCKKEDMSGEKNVQNEHFVYSEKKQFGELEFSFSIKILEKGLHDGINYLNNNLSINYEIKNTGGKEFVVFNRGHTAYVDGKSEVYVEPLEDGSIEISQKAFVQPKDKQCPFWLIPRISVGSLLKAQKTTKEQISLELPPKLNTPYADCKPSPVMPDKIKKAKFCVGVAEIRNQSELKINEKGIVQGRDGLAEQILLCSDTIELE